MNGIIHPCTHGSIPQCKTEDEMMIKIMNYVDRLIKFVQPKHVLYLSIDGVAPRAKMNQQRTRRFFSSFESEEKSEITELVKKWYAENPEIQNRDDEPWDKNVITPGTKFMIRLSQILYYYIYHRMNTDSNWKNVSLWIILLKQCS